MKRRTKVIIVIVVAFIFLGVMTGVYFGQGDQDQPDSGTLNLVTTTP